MNRKALQIMMVILGLALVACGGRGEKPTPVPGGTAQPAPSTLPATAILITATPVPPTVPPATALPLPTGTPIVQTIVVDAPASGSSVSNPIIVRGRATLMPFEATLLVRVYDGYGQLAAQTPVMVQGNAPGPVSFETSLLGGGIPGAGRVEVLDLSAQDGAVRASASVAVTFSSSGYVETPAPLARVTLPLHLLVRVGQPGQAINITVSWEGNPPGQSIQFAQPATVIADANGRGLILTTVNWPTATQVAHPNTQRASLHIHNTSGQLLAYQPLVILHPYDADTMSTNVYWEVGGQIVAEPLRIPRTLGIGRASLNALLWGPTPGNAAGYTTAIPTPEEVLRYPQRGAGWGERVILKDLKIVDGVAYADFSKELLAHDGGAARVLLIRQQIEQTLLQFSTVNRVVITVEGQSGLLEP